MERDLTNGKVLPLLVRFSLPFLFSSFIQTFYGLADLYIVSLFNGNDSITAVSVGSQVMHMVTVILIGLSMGATVTIGQFVGSGDEKQSSEAIGTAISLFFAITVAFMFPALIASGKIASLMRTPVEALPGTETYLRICFAGIPFIGLYNSSAAVFRGLGDSKSPMLAAVIACLSNIALDFLFMGYFALGPAGAAFGTVSAQAIAAFSSLAMLFGRKRIKFKPSRSIAKRIIGIGFPIACQEAFIQITFIIITVIANMRGLEDATAVGIVEKIITFLFLFPSSMVSSVSAMCAQNIGAGKHGRAVLTLKYAIILSLGWGALCVLAFTSFSRPILSMFTDDRTVILLGSGYITSYIWDVMFAGVHFSFSGYFSASGKSILSFIQNALSIVLVRIPGSIFLSAAFKDSLFPLGFASTFGSILSTAICTIFFVRLQRKRRKP